ncbi:phosphotransferase enzyme family protein [Devosia albogilva]|uniref:Phosphotransferase enzyme family protein n=1 Tax=Devosia albogilva TaxID=429726 RepID=A0ABW5QEI9_9HYPH
MPLSSGEVGPALSLWTETGGCEVGRLLNRSENETFLVETGQGAFTLRVHRVGYQSRPAIESELAWLSALRRDTNLDIPEPVPGRDGGLLQSFVTTTGEPRLAVLFRFVSGSEPQPDDDLVGLFGRLGEYAAVLHGHTEKWQRPSGFERPVWEAATILDADAPWGDWRLAPGVDRSVRSVLDRLDSALWLRLAEYGKSPERFGLIHADMRLGNLLVEGDRVTLIDFDDCGFCWFAYDFAAAISFHETQPVIPGLKAAWLEGYTRIRKLDAADLKSLDAMVMLRRMALLAWIGSHADTALAQQHMDGFAAGTAELAERYLAGALWPEG